MGQRDLELCAVFVSLDGADGATSVAHQMQRPQVLGKHVDREAPETDGSGTFRERLDELGTDAAALPLVDYLDGYIRNAVVPWIADEPCDADRSTVGQLGHQRHAIVAVDVSKLA